MYISAHGAKLVCFEHDQFTKGFNMVSKLILNSKDAKDIE